MAKFWYGAVCASFVFVATWFVWGGQMGAKALAPAPEETKQDSSMESLVREPNNSNTTKYLNSVIFAMKTKADVPKALKLIADHAVANPDDEVAQIYGLFVKPVSKFEGITWRLRNIVESVDVAYIGSIAYLRAFKRNSDRRAKHIDALFDYFTDPIPERAAAFASVSEFQNFMVEQIAPDVRDQLDGYKKILAHHPDDIPLFIFDPALILGEPKKDTQGKDIPYASTTSRDRKFMPGNLRGLMANMYERMGFGYYAASYNLEGLANFVNTLSRKSLAAKKANMDTGAGGAILADALNLGLQTPREVSRLLEKMGSFLTIRKEALSGDYLQKSLEALKEANELRIQAYGDMVEIKAKGNKNTYFTDAEYLTSRPAIDDKVLAKRRDLLTGAKANFTDRVDGSQFKINIAKLFDKNNQGIWDLKKLYPKPNQFKNDKQFEGKDKKTFRWNYDYGNPQGWPDPTFAGLLPDTKSAADYRPKLVSISRDASTPALTYWLRLFM